MSTLRSSVQIYSQIKERAMKEFIISILSLMGFGVNALVGDEEVFVRKLAEYVPNVELSLCRADEKGMSICVKTSSGKNFKIIYTYAEMSRKITKVMIKE